jgi:hypothetical protein
MRNGSGSEGIRRLARIDGIVVEIRVANAIAAEVRVVIATENEDTMTSVDTAETAV